MKTLLSIVIILITFSNGENLLNWKSSSIPNRDEIRKLNHYKNNIWEVYLKDNKPFVRVKNYKNRYDEKYPIEIDKEVVSELFYHGKRTYQKVENGWLVGFNRGEWGGGLYWFDEKGKNGYLIRYAHVKEIFEIEKEIYVVEGLAHLSVSEGEIFKVKKEKEKWEEEKFMKLDESPQTIILDKDNKFIIVFSNKVSSITIKKEIKDIMKEQVWEGYIYSNSMIINDENLYIGMRSGIIKVNLSHEGKYYWLTNK